MIHEWGCVGMIIFALPFSFSKKLLKWWWCDICLLLCKTRKNVLSNTFIEMHFCVYQLLWILHLAILWFSYREETQWLKWKWPNRGGPGWFKSPKAQWYQVNVNRCYLHLLGWSNAPTSYRVSANAFSLASYSEDFGYKKRVLIYLAHLGEHCNTFLLLSSTNINGRILFFDRHDTFTNV